MANLPTESLDTLLTTLPSLPRPILARLTARLIDRLDDIDGDPDLEDATNAEDEGLCPATLRYGPQGGCGCPVADAGEDNGDREEEQGRVPARDAYGLDQREMKHWGGCFRIA